KAATGRAPEAYLQALRIEAAKAMLERDATPIQRISSAVGYDDVAFFRGLFKRVTGMTPGEYRAHFPPLSVPASAMVHAIGAGSAVLLIVGVVVVAALAALVLEAARGALGVAGGVADMRLVAGR